MTPRTESLCRDVYHTNTPDEKPTTTCMDMSELNGIAIAVVGMVQMVLQVSRNYQKIKDFDFDQSSVDRLASECSKWSEKLDEIRSSVENLSQDDRDILEATERCVNRTDELFDLLEPCTRQSWKGFRSLIERNRRRPQQRDRQAKEEELEYALRILLRKTPLERESADMAVRLHKEVDLRNSQASHSAQRRADFDKGTSSRAFGPMAEQRSDTCDQSNRHTVLRGPWISKRILCLDGNDSKSMTCLYVLLHLMRQIACIEQETTPSADSSSQSPLYMHRNLSEDRSTNHDGSHIDLLLRYRPCHYFDYICGTGNGGMSAIMLGVMRFSVPEVIERTSTIFKVPRLPSSLHWIKSRQTKSLSSLELMLKRNLEDPATPCGDIPLSCHWKSSGQQATLQANKYVCQTICIAAWEEKKGVPQPFLLRSYDPKSIADRSAWNYSYRTWTLPVVDACLASVAVPLYSSSVKLSRFDGRFKDASRLDVTSAYEAYREIATSHGRPQVECLIAISSVHEKPSSSQHSIYRSRANAELEGILGDAFHQFEMSEEVLENSRDDDVDELNAHIKKIVDDYCREKEAALKKCAETLVKARRQRAQTVEWSTFARLNVSHGNRSGAKGWTT